MFHIFQLLFFSEKMENIWRFIQNIQIIFMNSCCARWLAISWSKVPEILPFYFYEQRACLCSNEAPTHFIKHINIVPLMKIIICTLFINTCSGRVSSFKILPRYPFVGWDGMNIYYILCLFQQSNQ